MKLTQIFSSIFALLIVFNEFAMQLPEAQTRYLIGIKNNSDRSLNIELQAKKSGNFEVVSRHRYQTGQTDQIFLPEQTTDVILSVYDNNNQLVAKDQVNLYSLASIPRINPMTYGISLKPGETLEGFMYDISHDMYRGNIYIMRNIYYLSQFESEFKKSLAASQGMETGIRPSTYAMMPLPAIPSAVPATPSKSQTVIFPSVPTHEPQIPVQQPVQPISEPISYMPAAPTPAIQQQAVEPIVPGMARIVVYNATGKSLGVQLIGALNGQPSAYGQLLFNETIHSKTQNQKNIAPGQSPVTIRVFDKDTLLFEDDIDFTEMKSSEVMFHLTENSKGDLQVSTYPQILHGREKRQIQADISQTRYQPVPVSPMPSQQISLVAPIGAGPLVKIQNASGSPIQMRVVTAQGTILADQVVDGSNWRIGSNGLNGPLIKRDLWETTGNFTIWNDVIPLNYFPLTIQVYGKDETHVGNVELLKETTISKPEDLNKEYSLIYKDNRPTRTGPTHRVFWWK